MRRGPGKVGRLAGAVLIGLVAVIIVGILNLPLINTLLTSLKTDATIHMSPPPVLPAPLTLEQYAKVLMPSEAVRMRFPQYLLNSIIIATGASLLTILTCLPAAYAFGRFGVGRRSFFPALVNLRAIPLVVFAIPIYILYQRIGLLDTLSGLVLLNTVVNIPLAILIFTGFLQGVPREMEDAARVDGASTLGVLRYVILPLMGPAVATVGILSFIQSWNEFLFGMILSVERSLPVTVGTTLFVGAWVVEWGAIAAAVMIGTLPSILFILFARRYIVAGMTAGAVKG